MRCNSAWEVRSPCCASGRIAEPHRCVPAISPPSFIPPARRDRRKAFAARMRSISGGRQYRSLAAIERRRRVVHDPAAVSHQCAQHVLPGAADGRVRGIRKAVLRLRLLFRRWAAAAPTVTYLLGAMVPILLSRPACRGTRTGVQHRARAGVPAQFHADFTRRTSIRLLDGWGSTETNFVLGTTTEHQQPGSDGAGVCGL